MEVAVSALAGELRLEEARTPERFAALRREWNDLADASGASIFNSWDWMHTWHRRVAPGRSLRILAARDGGGRLRGILPLCQEEKMFLGRRIRRLGFLGESQVGSDYLDILAPAPDREKLLALFADALRARSAGWDVLDLRDLSEESTTLAVFRKRFAAPAGEWRVSLAPRCLCPYEKLDPDAGFEAFLRGTSRRDNYLRRRKWLEKQPGFRIEVTREPGELARPLGEFFRLHRLRWAAEGGSLGIPGPRVEAFHREASALLAERGLLRLYTLHVGGEAVASVYAIRHGEKFLYYQSGYDPKWRAKSVGLVLVGATFQDALAAGMREYDFLRGTERYKFDWVKGLRKTVCLRVARRRGPAEWMRRYESAVDHLRRRVKADLLGKAEAAASPISRP